MVHLVAWYLLLLNTASKLC